MSVNPVAGQEPPPQADEVSKDMPTDYTDYTDYTDFLGHFVSVVNLPCDQFGCIVEKK